MSTDLNSAHNKNSTSKRVLIIMSRSPYSSSLAKEGLDYCLAAAAFEQDIDILFTCEGVLQLINNQAPDQISQKNISKILSALPIYGVDSLFVDKTSLTDYGLHEDWLSSSINSLDSSAVAALIDSADLIVNF